MPQLKPKEAAELAEEVYAVNRGPIDMEIFLSRPEFSRSPNSKHELKAEVGSRLIHTKDAFGICAHGGQTHENEIFIIFRGSTKLKADWMSNARIGIQPSTSGWPVHIGFNSVFKSMLPQIKEFLRGANNTATIHCIGHSLGGAVATLAADWLANNKAHPVNLYTFGAPKPGLMLFASNITKKVGKANIFCVYHATDPVPMVPLFPYIQPPLPGFGHYLPSSESIPSAGAHDISKYAKDVSNLTWDDMLRRRQPYSIESAVKFWLESKSPVHAGSHRIWDWINSALIFVLTKISGALIGTLQAGLMGALTLADTLAWMLSKGIEFSEKSGLSNIGRWVFLLMNKIMQVLGMGIPDESIEMTQVFMRNVLNKLITRTNEQAQRAVSGT